ncbi:MAG: GNAT family N-acetyltransferase [Phycicoccus sp.]|nr:GNAT family N-acetyltransferase [Phycicoccus sp.]
MSQSRLRPVTRGNVDVVPYTQDRRAELLGLWLAARVESGVSPENAARSVNESRFLDALARSDVRAKLARIDGVTVGYVVTAENPFGLGTHPEVSIEQMWVDPRVRRHGVARALLAAVVSQADQSRSEFIATNVPVQIKDANRFFARLGFTSVVTRRVVATSALRRRLAPVQGFELQMLRRRRLLGAPVRRTG